MTDDATPGTTTTPRRVLVTGATGYIGGRLVPQLLAAGHTVRCLSRDPRRLRDAAWRDRVEVAAGDVQDAESLAAAMDGIDVAYYLVHAIGSGRQFEERDRAAATTFAEAAGQAGTARVIYLGGLTPSGQRLSPHLRSRAEVGQILLEGPVPAIVLRAGVIIGSGSASFEMLRYLTERLPVMTTPRWVMSRVQPLAVRDALRYLVAAVDFPDGMNRTFDVGGPDVLTYEQMMQRYAAVAGLRRRWIVPVPLFSPNLSSHWVGLVTPVPGSIARPLVESLRNEVVCGEDDIRDYVPDRLLGFEESVGLALQRIRDANVTTRWSNASWPDAPSDPLPSDPDWAGGSLYTDLREVTVDADAEQVWRVIEGIGGENGWYSWQLAWMVRGLLDRVSGGVGLRRGRRDPQRLRVGESLDFWRVEEVVPGELLRLRAEMRLPGLAWLELSVHPGTGGVRYRQRALFHPRGLAGHLYWWAVRPFHGVVFGSMLRGIAAAAQDRPRRRFRRSR